MKEKPILMSAPMVCAILDGRKTMTRRIIKPQPDESKVNVKNIPPGFLRCPYGQPGDRLWVRETHYRYGRFEHKRFYPIVSKLGFSEGKDGVDFGSFDKVPPREIGWHKRPSIFMPRWASRITLEITDVKAEKLQDISEEDCFLEGIDFRREIFPRINRETKAKAHFQRLWECINGKGSWEKNPFCWTISFKRIN